MAAFNIDDTHENADWLRGLAGWPFPEIDSVEEMREFLGREGEIEAFKTTVLFRRWKDRKEWLKEL